MYYAISDDTQVGSNLPYTSRVPSLLIKYI